MKVHATQEVHFGHVKVGGVIEPDDVFAVDLISNYSHGSESSRKQKSLLTPQIIRMLKSKHPDTIYLN